MEVFFLPRWLLKARGHLLYCHQKPLRIHWIEAGVPTDKISALELNQYTLLVQMTRTLDGLPVYCTGILMCFLIFSIHPCTTAAATEVPALSC